MNIPNKAPFGATIIWGAKGVGKTLACLNSPWQPVYVIDTEFSSKEYYDNAKMMVEMGVLRAPFERVGCHDYTSFIKAKDELKAVGHVGTLVIDTGGQWSEWVALRHQSKPENKNKGQLVWADIRTELRNYLLSFAPLCDCLLLTAHESKYKTRVYPRCNPALMEIVAISIRLQRDLNQRVPWAEVRTSRVPFFPPRINNFSIEALLPYFETPFDWKKIKEEDMIPPEPTDEPEEDEE